MKEISKTKIKNAEVEDEQEEEPPVLVFENDVLGFLTLGPTEGPRGKIRLLVLWN